MPMDQYQAVDGRKAALQLLQGGNGTVTPFGVAYDNGMQQEGGQFNECGYVSYHGGMPWVECIQRMVLSNAGRKYRFKWKHRGRCS